MAVKGIGLAGVVAVALLLAPTAQASDVGEVVTRGPATFPAGSAFALHPLAMLANTTEAPIDFLLTAPRATVYLESAPVVGRSGPTVDGPRDERSFPLHDVRLRFLPGGTPGWWGVYAGEQDTLSVTTDTATTVEPMTTSVVGVPSTDPSSESPAVGFYSRETARPHLLTRIDGDFSMTFSGAIKIFGPHVEVSARENKTDERTGILGESPLPVRTRAWVVLVVEDARLTAGPRSPIEIAAPLCQVQWSGPLSFGSGTGTISSAHGEYAAQTGPQFIQGDFSADVAPLETDQGNSLQIHMVGLLSTTTFHQTQALHGAAVPRNPFTTGSFIVLGLAVLAGTTFAGARWARGRERAKVVPALDLEDLIELSNRAAEAERFDEALSWVRKARVISPTSARLMTDEGFYLGAIGEFDRAIEAYREAAALSKDGEAEFLAARLVLEMGTGHEDALALVEAALSKSPALLFEIEADPTLSAAVAGPSFQKVLRRARARLREP